MEHLGKRVILAVAQEPFEIPTDFGAVNSFATLVPVITTDGEMLPREDFRRHGLVFWLIRPHALGFADPGRLISGRLEQAIHPEKGHDFRFRSIHLLVHGSFTGAAIVAQAGRN
jgi:hypothetical protein